MWRAAWLCEGRQEPNKPGPEILRVVPSLDLSCQNALRQGRSLCKQCPAQRRSVCSGIWSRRPRSSLGRPTYSTFHSSTHAAVGRNVRERQSSPSLVFEKTDWVAQAHRGLLPLEVRRGDQMVFWLDTRASSVGSRLRPRPSPGLAPPRFVARGHRRCRGNARRPARGRPSQIV